jgi:hypothetical protein
MLKNASRYPVRMDNDAAPSTKLFGGSKTLARPMTPIEQIGTDSKAYWKKEASKNIHSIRFLQVTYFHSFYITIKCMTPFISQF